MQAQPSFGRRAVLGGVLPAAIFALSEPSLSAHAETENEARLRLEAEIAKRGGLDINRRGQFNEKALFTEDFYYKYGLRPTPSDIFAKTPEIPFSPVKRRYTGYEKYAPRIRSGIAAFVALGAAVETKDWAAVKAGTAPGTKSKGDKQPGTPPAEVRSFGRAMGLFANTALQSENEGTTSANLLARHLVNEYYFSLDDLEKAAGSGDSAAATAAWERSRDYIDGFLYLVNKAIIPKVGEQFPLLQPDAVA